MYNSEIFNKQKLLKWEEKFETDKTWTICKTFFKKYYQLKKIYSNVHSGKHGFESAANVNGRAHKNNYEAIDYLERLNKSEEMNQMATTKKNGRNLPANHQSKGGARQQNFNFDHKYGWINKYGRKNETNEGYKYAKQQDQQMTDVQ